MGKRRVMGSLGWMDKEGVMRKKRKNMVMEDMEEMMRKRMMDKFGDNIDWRRKRMRNSWKRICICDEW